MRLLSPIPEIFRTEGAAVRIGMCADHCCLDVKVEILARLADRGYAASDLCVLGGNQLEQRVVGLDLEGLLMLVVP
jgi:hypothetical protein